jgi:hypothetical protein
MHEISREAAGTMFAGPYFPDGSQAATLEQVLEFYSTNGDFPQSGNLGPGIGITINARRTYGRGRLSECS